MPTGSDLLWQENARVSLCHSRVVAMMLTRLASVLARPIFNVAPLRPTGIQVVETALLQMSTLRQSV
jgi:hypothetical protein